MSIEMYISCIFLSKAKYIFLHGNCIFCNNWSIYNTSNHRHGYICVMYSITALLWTSLSNHKYCYEHHVNIQSQTYCYEHNVNIQSQVVLYEHNASNQRYCYIYVMYPITGTYTMYLGTTTRFMYNYEYD